MINAYDNSYSMYSTDLDFETNINNSGIYDYLNYKNQDLSKINIKNQDKIPFEEPEVKKIMSPKPYINKVRPIFKNKDKSFIKTKKVVDKVPVVKDKPKNTLDSLNISLPFTKPITLHKPTLKVTEVPTEIPTDIPEYLKNKELILFHADWCGHSKKLMPVWEELSVELGNYNLRSVESKNKKEIRKYKIKAYPTILFVDNKINYIIQYTGDRSLFDLIQFAEKVFNMNKSEDNLVQPNMKKIVLNNIPKTTLLPLTTNKPTIGPINLLDELNDKLIKSESKDIVPSDESNILDGTFKKRKKRGRRKNFEFDIPVRMGKQVITNEQTAGPINLLDELVRPDRSVRENEEEEEEENEEEEEEEEYRRRRIEITDEPVIPNRSIRENRRKRRGITDEPTIGPVNLLDKLVRPNRSVRENKRKRSENRIKRREVTNKQVIINSDKHKKELVLFYANWCGYSKQFLPIWNDIILELDKLGYKYRMIESDNRDEIEEYKITGFPSLVFIDHDLDINILYKGVRNKESILSFVNDVFNKNNYKKKEKKDLLKINNNEIVLPEFKPQIKKRDLSDIINDQIDVILDDPPFKLVKLDKASILILVAVFFIIINYLINYFIDQMNYNDYAEFEL